MRLPKKEKKRFANKAERIKLYFPPIEGSEKRLFCIMQYATAVFCCRKPSHAPEWEPFIRSHFCRKFTFIFPSFHRTHVKLK